MKKGYDSLIAIPGMEAALADALYESGFYSADELALSSADDLMQVRDMTQEKALELIDAAQAYLEEKDRFDQADGEKQAGENDVSVAKASQTEGDSDESVETGDPSDSKAVFNSVPAKDVEATQGTATDRVEGDSAEA